MGFFARLLCVLLSFLMICNLITSLMGTEQPSFKTAMDIVSAVKIDPEELFHEFTFGYDVPELKPDEDASDLTKWFYGILNKLLYGFYQLLIGTYLVVGFVRLLFAISQKILYIAGALIYLVFGVNLMPDVEGEYSEYYDNFVNSMPSVNGDDPIDNDYDDGGLELEW